MAEIRLPHLLPPISPPTYCTPRPRLSAWMPCIAALPPQIRSDLRTHLLSVPIALAGAAAG
eukprot:3073426-Rhodomonas_salina.2